ncbi:MAG: hypothetical protein WCT28_00750 [Patescibacteria group bacterium]
MSKRFLVVLVALLLALISTSAFAAPPLRTLGRPFLSNVDMSVVEIKIGNGWYRIRNDTDFWIVPGNNGAGAGPGQARLFDSAESGVLVGLYLGPIMKVDTWNDYQLGSMDAIDGLFVSAMEPGSSAYVTVDPGVTQVLAWSVDFKPERNAVQKMAYDVRLKRVVWFTPGFAERIETRDCRPTKNPFILSSDPHFLMMRNQDCIH